jgi:hypothetical protein
MRVTTNSELTLLIPDSLLLQLELKARAQGVSLENLCLDLLSGEKQETENLVDPSFYPSLSHILAREEVNKVIQSSLPAEEIRRRVNRLEFEISRRYR